MRKEDLIIAGNKIYSICGNCGKLVRLNGIIKDMHICCLTEEEQIKQQQAAYLAQAQKLAPQIAPQIAPQNQKINDV